MAKGDVQVLSQRVPRCSSQRPVVGAGAAVVNGDGKTTPALANCGERDVTTGGTAAAGWARGEEHRKRRG